MIRQLSHRMAAGIKNAVPEHPVSIERMQYALSFLLNALFVILIALCISFFTGRTSETILVLIAFAMLRQVSGGIHLGSSWTCILISTIGATAISFVQLEHRYVILLTAISLVLALLYAPSRIEKQTRIPKKYYPLLKLIAALMITVNFFVASPVLAVTFAVQAATLIRGRR